jgi:hypothetical protein
MYCGLDVYTVYYKYDWKLIFMEILQYNVNIIYNVKHCYSKWIFWETKLNHTCYIPGSTHVCYRILVHVGFTGFENRHVTGVIPFCFPENSLGIAMFYMSMEKFVFQSWHRSVLVLKNRIMFWNCSSTLSQAGFRLVKRNYVLDLWFNFVTGRI